MPEAEPSGSGEEYEHVMRSLTAFTATQKELTRVFARSVQIHTTDADAVVLIIEAEERGRPLTPARLAERVGLSPGATSILLGRLEQAGHIERTREGSDRRIVTLRSTTTINASADAFFEPLHQRLDQALGEFTAEQLALVARAADNLRATVETYLRGCETSPQDGP